MKVSFVIPNFNGETLLQRNMPCVLEVIEKSGKSLDLTIEVIIVDDGSTDESLSVLDGLMDKAASRHVSMQVLKNAQNKGFAPTVNKGVRVATGDIIILLNTDVLPREGFLAPLLTHFSNPEVFAVGCMDESREKGKTVLRGRGLGEWKRGFLEHRRGEVDKSDALWVSGGSGAFRKSIWDSLGGLCTLYAPFYWEDIDLSYRAQKAGYKIIFENKSIVEHKHDSGSIKKASTEEQIKVTAYRNQFFFVWLNITDTTLLLSHIFWLPYHIGKALKNNDSPFLKGLGQAMLHLGKVLQYRSRYKMLFSISDKKILSRYG